MEDWRQISPLVNYGQHQQHCQSFVNGVKFCYTNLFSQDRQKNWYCSMVRATDSCYCCHFSSPIRVHFILLQVGLDFSIDWMWLAYNDVKRWHGYAGTYSWDTCPFWSNKLTSYNHCFLFRHLTVTYYHFKKLGLLL